MVLLLEQKPSVLHINLNHRDLGYKISNRILKNHGQKTVDAIIGEKQSVATKNRTTVHTFSTSRDIIDVPYKSNLALTFLNFRDLFTE